jgi:glycosyltransferase involved in cell wall biosynthesis
MRILWQNEHYPDVTKGGGGAVNTFYIVRAMLAEGHNALILSQGGHRQSVTNENVNGTPVLRVPEPPVPEKFWPLWPLLASYYLKGMVTELCSNYDGFVAIDAPYALAFKRLFSSRPLVYRIETTERSHAAAVPAVKKLNSRSLSEMKLNAVQRVMTYENEFVEQLAWRAADALVVKSEFMRNELATLYDLKETDKVHVIPNGVDYARYADAKVGTVVLERLQKTDDKKVVIIYCGRLVRLKHIDFLLEAFARMQNRDNCVLAILGDGEERINLETQAGNLGVSDRVRFIGKTNQVEEYLAAGDIFVFPSTYEAFGNALVEAMAAGLACVVLKPDGVRIRTASAEIIKNGCSGFLVDPVVAELTNRLDSLVADQNLRRSVGKEAQSVARERYDWAKCAQEYIRLLENNKPAV